MDIYQTEEQQVDAIKAFWKDNGVGIIAGLVIGLSAFVGYGFYSENQAKEEIQTAEAYQAVIDSAAQENGQFTQKAEDFIATHESSSYAALTALSLAKEASSHQDWNDAEKYLLIASEKTQSAGVKAIAITRLARVQIQLEKIEAALATLATPLPESYTSTVEEIKGDAYLQQGKPELARNAYQVALVASGNNNPILQIKIDDLAEISVVTQ